VNRLRNLTEILNSCWVTPARTCPAGSLNRFCQPLSKGRSHISLTVPAILIHSFSLTTP